MQDVQPTCYVTADEYLEFQCNCETTYEIHEGVRRAIVKTEKPFIEYVKENNDMDKVDLKTGNVYNHPSYLVRHQKYLEYQKNKQQENNQER